MHDLTTLPVAAETTRMSLSGTLLSGLRHSSRACTCGAVTVTLIMKRWLPTVDHQPDLMETGSGHGMLLPIVCAAVLLLPGLLKVKAGTEAEEEEEVAEEEEEVEELPVVVVVVAAAAAAALCWRKCLCAVLQ